MSKDARTFMNEKIRELSQETVTVTVRLKPKYYLMLKELSDRYSFPISSSFSEMVTEHLFDMMINLEDEDFDFLTKHIDENRFSIGRRLAEEGLTGAFKIAVPDTITKEQHDKP